MTLVVNGQRGSGFDEGFMSQATMLAVFRMTSHKEIRTVKERFSVLAAYSGHRDHQDRRIAISGIGP